MCTGLEIAAVVSAVSAVASTGFSIVSGQQQAKAAQASAEFNASMMDQEAQDALARTEEEENQYRRESQQRRAGVEARMVGNGIDISGGSSGSLLSDYAEIEQMDAERIRESGNREAQGKLDQAAMTRADGKNAALAGQIGAAGSLLSGASMVADRWASRPSGGGAKTRGPNGNFI